MKVNFETLNDECHQKYMLKSEYEKQVLLFNQVIVIMVQLQEG